MKNQAQPQKNKKESKAYKKIIRTCIHQPFEFNMRTLDQNKSIDLAKEIINISTLLNVKCGIKSAIRKLRQKEPLLGVILILDQSIMEVLLQAATVFWKYEQPIILAREDARNQLFKHFKIHKINCVYIYEKKGQNYDEVEKQKIEEFQNLLQFCTQDSKCEIPLIIDTQEIKLKQMRLLHHTQQIDKEVKQDKKVKQDQ